MNAPNPKVLTSAIEELRHNHSFGVFLDWVRSVREEAVQSALNPNNTEQLGMLNRAAGNIEAFDTVLLRVGLVNVQLDNSTEAVQPSDHAESFRSGAAQ